MPGTDYRRSTIIPERLVHLQAGDVPLYRDSHSIASRQYCFNEAAAWLAGEPHSDEPQCVSPVLRDFTTSLNDDWDYQARQQLLPYVEKVVGTAGDGQDEARTYLALDWLVRNYAPVWLQAAGLMKGARQLRALGQVRDYASAAAARPVVEAVRQDSATAAVSARTTNWGAGRDAVEASGGDAARQAAWSVLGEGALAIAGDAASLVVGGQDVGGLVGLLQESALDLLGRMIDPGAQA